MSESAATILWSGDPPASLTASVIPITGHFDTHSGFGGYSTALSAEFLRRGFQVELYPLSLNDFGTPLPPTVKAAVRKSTNPHPWELVIYPCVIRPASYEGFGSRRTAYLTLWESTRLSGSSNPDYADAIRDMNKCAVVMTASAWNATAFSACGVDTPIRIVPLGIDATRFAFSENTIGNPFVFGSAGRTSGGGTRKGLSTVYQAFQRAFPAERDVLLSIKEFSDDPRLPGSDPRVKSIHDYFTPDQLVEWYRSINVFVSGSHSEGWGLHQHEAMYMGRPVVGVNFGGVCEFFNEANGYPVDWTLAPAKFFYEGMGHYARPSIESMATQMRRCYENHKLVRVKGRLAAESAGRFTITHSADCILKVLREFKFIQ